jgi:hypothetical protein
LNTERVVPVAMSSFRRSEALAGTLRDLTPGFGYQSLLCINISLISIIFLCPLLSYILLYTPSLLQLKYFFCYYSFFSLLFQCSPRLFNVPERSNRIDKDK